MPGITLEMIKAWNAEVTAGQMALQDTGDSRQFVKMFGEGSTFGAEGIPPIVDSLCEVATILVNNQVFRGGNHRTAIFVIYLGLLEGAGVYARRSVYQAYACQDHGYYLHSREKYDKVKDNCEALKNLVGRAGGTFWDNPQKRLEYCGKIKAEVLALPDLLERIGSNEPIAETVHPRGHRIGLKEQIKIFKNLHGGTTAHAAFR